MVHSRVAMGDGDRTQTAAVHTATGGWLGCILVYNNKLGASVGSAAAAAAVAALALLQAAAHPALGRVLLVAMIIVGAGALHSGHAAALPVPGKLLLLAEQHMHSGACMTQHDDEGGGGKR